MHLYLYLYEQMSVSDEEDFYEFNYYILSENFKSDVFFFLKKLPPLIYIVLLFFCLSLIIVSLGEIQSDMVDGFLTCTESELYMHANCTTKLEETAVVNEYKHGQHDVQMDSVDEVSMGDEDDQSNYHRRSDGDAIRRAVEEARLAEKKRTEEAVARTKARAHVPKNRGYFLLRNSV
jgi:hypothetical protein